MRSYKSPYTLPTALFSILFFFNDTATTEIYPLSLHDALPILLTDIRPVRYDSATHLPVWLDDGEKLVKPNRSEEHTSELQSLTNLVCRLLLEKKKKTM